MADLRIVDVDNLAGELRRLSQLRFDAVIEKNMAQIYNRGKRNSKTSGTGTPVDTGELRISLGKQRDAVGYAKDYAPHVEYGHRTAGGGWVPGQRFLQKNVEQQRPIFKRDLVNQLKGGRGR